ncbi:bacteriohemerythrin [Marinobacterium jannaschii]|uniref:bacteriohemerythrin n=1 Tax=Marinobacterium jannaschii TaxID=64970 RepID=UPI0004891E7B|nr:hemerythrin family protein [Marinobacterium jannaschii]
MHNSHTSTLIDLHPLTGVVLDSYNEAHNIFADLANRLYDLLIASKGGDPHDYAITESIDMLISHTAQQFEYENKEMQRRAFPAAPQHIEEHREALEKLVRARRKWLTAGNADRLDHYLTRELAPWLVSHITRMDSVAAMYIAADKMVPEKPESKATPSAALNASESNKPDSLSGR